jgi:hypothetical protein
MLKKLEEVIKLNLKSFQEGVSWVGEVQSTLESKNKEPIYATSGATSKGIFSFCEGGCNDIGCTHGCNSGGDTVDLGFENKYVSRKDNEEEPKYHS